MDCHRYIITDAKHVISFKESFAQGNMTTIMIVDYAMDPINSKLEDYGRAPLWRAANLQALWEHDSINNLTLAMAMSFVWHA